MHATSLSSVGPAAREYVHTHHSMSLVPAVVEETPLKVAVAVEKLEMG
jgi:hypothetical protein